MEESMWPGSHPMFNPSTFTSVFPLMEGEMDADGLVFVVGNVVGVYPLHLFLNVLSNVYI